MIRRIIDSLTKNQDYWDTYISITFHPLWWCMDFDVDTKKMKLITIAFGPLDISISWESFRKGHV
jgi:hypothetical protein